MQSAFDMSKSENRQRTQRLTFRVLPKERDEFVCRCEEAGLTKADYFRQKCLEDKPLRKRKKLPVEAQLLAKYLAHVGKIGSNINQVAKNANTGYPPNANMLDKMSQDIQMMREMLRQTLGYGD